MLSAPKVTVIYDGDCPFCSSYVSLIGLRKLTDVDLIDARSDHPILRATEIQALDLNAGMVVKVGQAVHHGADAMHVLSMLSTGSGFISRLALRAFASPTRSRLLYPYLRAGRNLTLRILGRPAIQSLTQNADLKET